MEEEKKPMHVKVTISAHLPRVWGDAERVRLILDNLLENAYQYTPENGHIQVTMHQLGDEVQVDVKDDGIGISPEEAPRVFERFYRGEHPLVLANSGTGLGLSIVHNLISMHNGRIWLESGGIPGQGSTFSFTLPVYKPGEAEP
jgi:signal transduction histidine kinase